MVVLNFGQIIPFILKIMHVIDIILLFTYCHFIEINKKLEGKHDKIDVQAYLRLEIQEIHSGLNFYSCEATISSPSVFLRRQLWIKSHTIVIYLNRLCIKLCFKTQRFT